MKIGFKFHSRPSYKLGSLKTGQQRSLVGDEMTAVSLRKELLKLPDVEYCELFNGEPSKKLDVMVYFHEDTPNRDWAKKSVLYMQRPCNIGSDKVLATFQELNYDGYMFISNKLLQLHKEMGHEGLFLPTAGDDEYMRPMPVDERYIFEVSYVGNDIKGLSRTMRYIYPAKEFSFGLFGGWKNYSALKDCLSHRGFFLRYFINGYRREFRDISQGQIPYDDLPVLYSSAKIVLNCTHQDNVDWEVITGRVYDVLLCNGFLITDVATPQTERYRDCMVVTSGGEDLRKKIRYYLEHEDERKIIASRGRERVLEKDTFRHRAIDIVNYFRKIL